VILVTGATGNTGSALLQELEKRAAVVRAMVRSSKDAARQPKTSATPVVANFDDSRSLEAALAGVTRAYLVTPSSPDAEAQQVRFAECAAECAVAHRTSRAC
jgi:uncharacterized protein YbjT (DUF2867 family)